VSIRALALLGLRLLALGHEVVTCARTLLKQVVPPPALWYDQAAAANLQNIHLMHPLGTARQALRAGWMPTRRDPLQLE
jgi:hypothetical protein